MRVMCINAKPIEGHGNKDLHLIKEGETYKVLNVHSEGGYDIGVQNSTSKKYGIATYWGPNRFMECSEESEEEVNINIKGRVDGNKRSSSEEDQGSDSNKPI